MSGDLFTEDDYKGWPLPAPQNVEEFFKQQDVLDRAAAEVSETDAWQAAVQQAKADITHRLRDLDCSPEVAADALHEIEEWLRGIGL